MINRRTLMQFFAVFLMAVSGIYFGCNSKTDKPNEQSDGVNTEMDNPDKVTENSGDRTPDGSEMNSNNEEMVEEPMVTIPDIKGTYSGTFDKRSTVLKITEQTDSSFSGKITINYRQVINQDVKGSFSPTTKKMTMKDQLHSRYQGKYTGKLSDDMTKFSGTFTMDLDGKQFSFNLTKK